MAGFEVLQGVSLTGHFEITLHDQIVPALNSNAAAETAHAEF
jgi:hypothetical protein